jgi:ribosomal-protein-alanine acetyltransferase
VRIRPAISADIDAMLNLQGQSPFAAHWSRQQYEAIFSADEPGPTQRLTFVVEEAAPQAWTLAGAPRILAFLAAHRVDREWELENIVVAEDSRRRRLGILLLNEFIDRARRSNARAISLEVRESNQPARALYTKAGFVGIGRRKHYYAVPTEDAILYRLSLD